MDDLVFRCHQMELAPAQRLIADLPVQGPFVCFDRKVQSAPFSVIC
jgi:hypothetical protein